MARGKPAGSWFTSMAEDWTRDYLSIPSLPTQRQERDLNSGGRASELQVRRSNHSATLPSVKHYWNVNMRGNTNVS